MPGEEKWIRPNRSRSSLRRKGKFALPDPASQLLNLPANRRHPKAGGQRWSAPSIKEANMDSQLPAEMARLVNTAQLPQLYEQAKNALAECEKLDECAEWADKAAAIASYAQQADDAELENCARRIRARAVRRCGELLRAFDARGRGKSEAPLVFKSRTAVAQEAGLTDYKRRTAVNIADIPIDEFDAAIE